MSDAFESRLGALFAESPPMPDAYVFAVDVERRLKRRFSWTLIAAAAGVGIAALVTAPLLGWLTEQAAVQAGVAMAKADDLNPVSLTALAVGMALLAGLAVLIGRWQAARF